MTTTDSNYRRMADLMKQVADPTRLRVMAALEGRDRNVTQLCDDAGAPSQPALSHHLSLLRLAGMVERRRDGKCNFYSLTDPGRRLLAAAQSLAE